MHCCREQSIRVSTLYRSLAQNQYDFCYITVSLASVKMTDLLAETLCVSSVGGSHCRKGSQNHYPNLRDENRALEITGIFRKAWLLQLGLAELFSGH